jgi:hypothetical protein
MLEEHNNGKASWYYSSVASKRAAISMHTVKYNKLSPKLLPFTRSLKKQFVKPTKQSGPICKPTLFDVLSFDTGLQE